MRTPTTENSITINLQMWFVKDPATLKHVLVGCRTDTHGDTTRFSGV